MRADYFGYTDVAYRNSLSANYLYTCTISTNDVLTNVTLFLPVPAEPNGNSPVVTQISNHDVSGVPDTMNLTLYDTGKATLLKVSANSIGSPVINGTTQPVTVMFTVNESSHEHIDTTSPVQNAAVFRRLTGFTRLPVFLPWIVTSNTSPVCYQYLTYTYADYSAAPSTTVNINESVYRD